MALSEKDRALIGKESEPVHAPDEVSKSMIRHFCEMMEDPNPLYTDEEYAKNSKYGGIIAPPQMLMVWCMPRMWPCADTSIARRSAAISPPDFTRRISWR